MAVARKDKQVGENTNQDDALSSQREIRGNRTGGDIKLTPRL